jgi:ParB-like nuclease domain.
MSQNTYTEKDIAVGDLTIDRRVQRSGYDRAKVERMVKEFNQDALGVVTVSHRKDLSYVIIDGQHRWETVRRVTDNQGTLRCRVFEGLTIEEEAQMFLDLNHTTAPRLIDKFKVRITRQDPAAVEIAGIIGAYGWTVSHVPANGNINAVGVLERIYKLSVKNEVEPNLVHSTILVITRAWGNDRSGAQAVIFEGIGRLLDEYRDRVDLDILIQRMKEFKGGPLTLHAEAGQLAAIRKGKVSMAVAELLVEAYNKGRRTNVLAPWRKRS